MRTIRSPNSAQIEIPLDRYPELASAGGRVRVLHPTARLVFVTRTDAGVTALSGVCTHQGCEVESAGSGFRCPCHGSSFDAEGARQGGPARRALREYPARVVDELVIVKLNG